VKDTFKFLRDPYLKLMNLSTQHIPDKWKMSRVLPLHKKGLKNNPDNFRPISNLCSLDKLFEKIVLNEINRRHPGLEGLHQHRFRPQHSTPTAMVEIQQKIVDKFDKGLDTLLYSVDLLATFDLLRKDIFYDTLKDDLHPDLMDIIMDFLSDRKVVLEIDSKVSTTRDIPLGCVQGSILGSNCLIFI